MAFTTTLWNVLPKNSRNKTEVYHVAVAVAIHTTVSVLVVEANVAGREECLVGSDRLGVSKYLAIV